MGAMKDFLIGVEELVWEALERGMTTFDEIYAYVYAQEARADEDAVKTVLANISSGPLDNDPPTS